MIIEGNKVCLRYLQENDTDALLQWENDKNIWEISDTRKIFSRESIVQFIHSHQDIYLQKQLRLMICDKGSDARLGCADLFDFDAYHGRAGVGILIYDNANRRRGFAADAMRVVMSFGKDYLKLRQIYCNVLEDNLASINLFKKIGFREIGTKIQWHKSKNGWKNEVMFQYLIPEYGG